VAATTPAPTPAPTPAVFVNSRDASAADSAPNFGSSRASAQSPPKALGGHALMSRESMTELVSRRWRKNVRWRQKKCYNYVRGELN
jgi:hypothetical protein